MLHGQTALVTNVTAFCGLPSAQALAAAGATVLCHDRSFAEPGSRAEFQRAHPTLVALAAQTPAEIVTAVEAQNGALHVLVNNDAHPADRAPIEVATAAALRAAFEDLAVFPFTMCGAVVPLMKRFKSGRIVFIGSAAPLRGLANYAVYCAARGAANSLAKSLAQELARHNIPVNMVAANFVESPNYFPRALLEDAEARAKILRQVPLGRLGRPEEVAALVVFLASGKSDFMTGQVLPIAGGWV